MDKLAMQDADKRVKAQMLIDLANRGGTAPAQKVAMQGVSQYREMTKDLQED